MCLTQHSLPVLVLLPSRFHGSATFAMSHACTLWISRRCSRWLHAHALDLLSLLALARCCRSCLRVADSTLAWREVKPSKQTDVKPSDGRGHRVDTHDCDACWHTHGWSGFTPAPSFDSVVSGARACHDAIPVYSNLCQ